jgi:multidrug efflux pump subunit AcrA (membrane-fusion protein)
MATLIADSEARAVTAAVTTLTCIHHTDQQRADCPVCVVKKLRAEVERLEAQRENLLKPMRDQAIARADYAFWKDAASNRAKHLESASEQMLAYEDTILKLRAELAKERARLDYLQEWGFDFLTRDTIDAAMKEGVK